MRAEPTITTTLSEDVRGGGSPSRTTRASATDRSVRDRGPGERRGGSSRARRANSDFHHLKDASATPRWSANARAELPLDSHAATRSAHFAALSLVLMRVMLRRCRHPRKVAPSSSGYASSRCTATGTRTWRSRAGSTTRAFRLRGSSRESTHPSLEEGHDPEAAAKQPSSPSIFSGMRWRAMAVSRAPRRG